MKKQLTLILFFIIFYKPLYAIETSQTNITTQNYDLHDHTTNPSSIIIIDGKSLNIDSFSIKYKNGTENTFTNFKIKSLSPDIAYCISKTLYPKSNGKGVLKISYNESETYIPIFIKNMTITPTWSIPDSDHDGTPDSEDPLPEISTYLYSELLIKNSYIRDASFINPRMKVSSTYNGSLVDYTLTAQSKLNGFITNYSSKNLYIEQIMLLASEYSDDNFYTEYIEPYYLPVISKVSTPNIPINTVLEPNKETGIQITLNTDIDMRGFGPRFAWVVNTDQNNPNTRAILLSPPPIFADQDKDGIEDYKDSDDNNNGILDILEQKTSVHTWLQTKEIDATFQAIKIPEEENTYYFFPNTLHPFGMSEWHFGDGSYSTSQNPIHKFKNNGNYNINCILGFTDNGIYFKETTQSLTPFEKFGDIAPQGNTDNKITIQDAILALQYATNNIPKTKEIIQLGDISPLKKINNQYYQIQGDNKISIGDAVILLKASLGLITWEKMPPIQ